MGQHVDGFHAPINHPTSRGQACAQEAAVEQTFLPWEKQLPLSFSTNGKDSTQCLLACILHTAALNTDPAFSLLKWSHAPWKPSISPIDSCQFCPSLSQDGSIQCNNCLQWCRHTLYTAVLQQVAVLSCNGTLNVLTSSLHSLKVKLNTHSHALCMSKQP